MVHSAMDELLITTTRDVNLYHGDQSIVSGYVHLVRSLGGPIFNLFVVGMCFPTTAAWDANRFTEN